MEPGKPACHFSSHTPPMQQLGLPGPQTGAANYITGSIPNIMEQIMLTSPWVNAPGSPMTYEQILESIETGSPRRCVRALTQIAGETLLLSDEQTRGLLDFVVSCFGSQDAFQLEYYALQAIFNISGNNVDIFIDLILYRLREEEDDYRTLATIISKTAPYLETRMPRLQQVADCLLEMIDKAADHYQLKRSICLLKEVVRISRDPRITRQLVEWAIEKGDSIDDRTSAKLSPFSHAAIDIFSIAPYDDAIPRLLEFIEEGSETFNIIAMLGAIASESDITPDDLFRFLAHLEQRLSHSDWRIRVHAAEVLGKLAPKIPQERQNGVIQTLIEVIDRNEFTLWDMKAQEVTAWALGQIAKIVTLPEQIQSIMACLINVSENHEDDDLRASAVRAMGVIGQAENDVHVFRIIFDKLTDLLGAQNSRMSKVAAKTLQKMAPSRPPDQRTHISDQVFRIAEVTQQALQFRQKDRRTEYSAKAHVQVVWFLRDIIEIVPINEGNHLLNVVRNATPIDKSVQEVISEVLQTFENG